MLVVWDMKERFGNSIFTNLEGWAGGAVGTIWRYRFAQGLTLFGGVALFLLFVSKRHDCVDYLGVAVLISTFSIAFRLMYLKALRPCISRHNTLRVANKAMCRLRKKSRPSKLQRYLS